MIKQRRFLGINDDVESNEYEQKKYRRNIDSIEIFSGSADPIRNGFITADGRVEQEGRTFIFKGFKKYL